MTGAIVGGGACWLVPELGRAPRKLNGARCRAHRRNGYGRRGARSVHGELRNGRAAGRSVAFREPISILTVGIPPQIRVQGELVPVSGHSALTSRKRMRSSRVCSHSSNSRGWDLSREYDFLIHLAGPGPECEDSAYSQRGCTALALRVIPQRIPTPSELGLPPVIGDLARSAPGSDPGHRPDRVGKVHRRSPRSSTRSTSSGRATSSPSRTRSSTSTTHARPP